MPPLPPSDAAAAGARPADAAAAAVEIAVVIPAHRQPGLLPEAIASVLAQRGAPPTAAVVVDDGCPFPETRRTAAAFAAAEPGRVFALRRPNGGLSAARNTGIDFALRAFPALSAVYFLDADNRLHPPFLARVAAALAAAPPEVGWVYPDFDMFGVAQNHASRPWSLLAELTENLCEAGSLVRRAVLDRAGLRFDEAMRGGFEDWDFWLQAAAAGFRGLHLPDAGFRYRRRPESMLAEAERQRPALLAALRRRHAALFAPRRLLALEAAEAPRLALYGPEAAEVRLLLDPAAGEAAEVLTAEAARDRLIAAEEDPTAAAHFPAILAFAAPEALDALREARLLRAVFWQAEVLLRDGAEAVAVDLLRGPDPAEAAIAVPPGQGAALGAAMVFAARGLLAEARARSSGGWVESLATARPLPPVRRLRATLPDGVGPTALFAGEGGALAAGGGVPRDVCAAGDGATAPLRRLLLEAALLRAARRRRTAVPPGWRRTFLSPREGDAARARAALGLGATLPRRPEPGRRSIGFVLPLFSLGGVERVVLNQAAVLRRRGWATRLVVLGDGDGRALLPRRAREAFDDVVPVPGRGAATADWRRPYLGAETPAFGGGPAAADALGLLADLDVVVNTHGLGAHALMARLGRLGVRRFVGLHLVERGEWGQPLGTPHTALAYEHAYDGALVISEGLRAWCVAQGWPAATLHLVRNAPGHPTPQAAAVAALAARAARRAGGGTAPPPPLRALFLGRLDAQKGVDRLAAIIAATRGAPVAWRVVGRPVLEETPPDLGVEPEPPTTEPAALDALYAWADVLVLPSRFEGVPLVVLEAQRMGCAVLATDAGETAEVVAQGEDGFLLPQRGRPEAALVADFAAQLARLAADPGLLLEVGRRAAARVAAAGGWEETMGGFLDHLDRVAPPR